MLPILLNVYSVTTRANILGKSGGKQNLPLIDIPLQMKLSYFPKDCHLENKLLLSATTLQHSHQGMTDTKQIQGCIWQSHNTMSSHHTVSRLFAFWILPFFKFYLLFHIVPLYDLCFCVIVGILSMLLSGSLCLFLFLVPFFHVLFLLFILTYSIFWFCLFAYVFCLLILLLSLQHLFVFKWEKECI